MRYKNLYNFYHTHFDVRRPGLAVRRRGLTLIELLVTVGIMAIMVMTFGQILNSSQRAVSDSQVTMRTCAAGAAIEKVIRDDLRKVTRNGFLCITQTGLNSPPRLIAVTAGITPSKTGTAIGNGGIVSLGLCNNHDSSGDPIIPANVLFHQAWVLTGGTMGAGHDILQWDLEGIVRLPRSVGSYNPTTSAYDMNDLAGFVGLTWAPGASGSPIRIPANSLDDLSAMWQVLASQCDRLSIMWTDGTPDASNNLNWYGVACEVDDQGTLDESDDTFTYVPYCVGPGGPDINIWHDVPMTNNPNQIEFDVDPTPSDDIYRALWTKDNQSNWPVAIRIRFRISDPGVIGTENTSREYEIVCPVGQ